MFKYIFFLSYFLTVSLTTQAAIFEKMKGPDYYESYTREDFKHNRWSDGKKLLDECWKEYGSMSVMNELMGWYYYHYKKYDKARFYLVRALRDDKTNTHARELVEKVEEETKNYSSAICYINELLENNPYSRGLWRKKIELYRKQGNKYEADRLLLRLQQIYPNDKVVAKDVAYLHELNLSEQKKAGDLNGQLETLSQLVTEYPKNADYYMQYTNALLQAGRVSEATEWAAKGARLTGNPALVTKRAGILAEQGRYVEAIAYLKESQKTHPSASLTTTINEMEEAAADAAQMNDPYTATARVYAKQHKGEALNYLLNTAIARGYYDDALNYISEAKKGKSESEDLLYKEFIVHRRLGNKNAAMTVLTKLHAKNPRNQEVTEYLAEMHYEAGSEQMRYGMFNDAIADIQFAAENAIDPELKKGAQQRLLTCYNETKRYEQAQRLLDKMKADYSATRYDMQRAAIMQAQGKTDQALQLLAEAYDNEKNNDERQLIAYQYEEYALPYIKGLIAKGMIRQADRVVRRGITVCPSSNDMLHQAITTSNILGNKAGYEDMVMKARREYPEDPFFLVKEAEIRNQKKDYQGAVDLLRPELDTFIGDSALVAAFSVSSQQLALSQSKAKAYNTALATIDTALVYRADDRELLYTKGIVFEQMHQYDSAYVYQRYYKASLYDYREHGRHLEELQGQSFNNSLELMYQQARPGDEDIISANAAATFTHKWRLNDISVHLGYAGRDGISSDDKTAKDMETGGTGVQLGVDWKHRFDGRYHRWALGLGAAWASKYYPQVTLRADVEYSTDNDWVYDLHGSYRRIHAYNRIFEWLFDTDDETWKWTPVGWEHKYQNLFQLGLSAQKTIGQWVLAGGVDAFYLNKDLYFNGSVKGQFFPIEGSKTHVFAGAGLGTAPQTELLDNSMPGGFSKLNTFVSGGLFWVFNRHLAGTLSGTWYTLYRSQDILTGDFNSAVHTSTTDYKNMYYVQGILHISF